MALPTLSVSLALEPQVYNRITDTTLPTLTIEAVLDASKPITICTWHTILKPRQALQQRGFEIIDKSTNCPVRQLTKKNKRSAIKRQFGIPDEQLFVTLLPQVPYTVGTSFRPLQNGIEDAEGEPVLGMRGLKKGAYTLRVSREEKNGRIGWWRYGTKEDNLEPAGVEGVHCALGDLKEPWPLPIDPSRIPSIDFVIL